MALVINYVWCHRLGLEFRLWVELHYSCLSFFLTVIWQNCHIKHWKQYGHWSFSWGWVVMVMSPPPISCRPRCIFFPYKWHVTICARNEFALGPSQLHVPQITLKNNLYLSHLCWCISRDVISTQLKSESGPWHGEKFYGFLMSFASCYRDCPSERNLTFFLEKCLCSIWLIYKIIATVKLCTELLIWLNV